MTVLFFVLLLLALVFLLLGAFRVVHTRVELVPLGLACFVAVFFIQTLQKL